jgi:hypothetical protein
MVGRLTDCGPIPDRPGAEAAAPAVIVASLPYHVRQFTSDNAAWSPDGIGRMTSRGFLKWLSGAALIGFAVGMLSSPSAGLVIGTAIAVGAFSILPKPEDYGNDPFEAPRDDSVAETTALGDWWAIDEPARLVPFHVADPWPSLAKQRRNRATRHRLIGRRFESVRRARDRRARAGGAAGRKAPLRRR